MAGVGIVSTEGRVVVAAEDVPITPPLLSPSGESLDRLLHGWQGRLTQGISPPALGLAFFDWWVHLANSPGFQAELVADALGRLAP